MTQKQKPTLELKSIKVLLANSQETLCYNAKLYVDGKLWGTVSNDGHGGCDYQHPLKGGWDEVRKLNELIKETYPEQSYTIEYGGKTETKTFKPDLEDICSKLVEEHLFEKKWKTRLKNQLVAVNTKEMEIYTWPRRMGASKETIKRYEESGGFRDYLFLNSLPFDLAASHIKDVIEHQKNHN